MRFTMSDYAEYEKSLRELMQLCADGCCDNDRADDVRHDMVNIWPKLTPQETKEAVVLSEKLQKHHCDCTRKGLPFSDHALVT